jgi:hypothetical protein
MIAGSGSGRRDHDDEAATIEAVVHIFAGTIDTTKRRDCCRFAADLGIEQF